MSSRRTRHSDDEILKASKHLGYCVSMLAHVSKRLVEEDYRDSVEKNVLVDSFSLYLRNLIEFLYSDKNRGNDHMVAEDFFPEPSAPTKSKWRGIRPVITKDLQAARVSAHKRMAHLSYDRDRDETKNWNVVGLAMDLVNPLEALLTESKKGLISSDVMQDIKTSVKTFGGLSVKTDGESLSFSTDMPQVAGQSVVVGPPNPVRPM